jgi:ribonuclease Z
MPYLHLLGTGAAMSDPHRTVTMLAVEDENDVYLIDCGGDAVQRMLALGIPLDKLRGVVVTHEHPDHVGAFPLLMEKLWLSGRSQKVDVYGIVPAIETARRLLETFDISGWEGMPRLEWHEVDHAPGAEVLSSGPWRITAAPGTHSVPVVGLRIEYRPRTAAAPGGAAPAAAANAGSATAPAPREAADDPCVLAYSCDTELSERIVDLSRGAGILVHEATGHASGHSSVEDAATAGARAGVERVILCHMPPKGQLTDAMIGAARRIHAHLDRGIEGGSYEW